MPIQTATVKQLARRIKEYPGRFALFLGAGASVESGIPAASWMIRDFKRRILKDECPDCFTTNAEKENWLTTQPWYDANNPYGSLFEHHEPKEIGRQRYIEKLIEGRKPSAGYVMLANLLARGLVNTVITTNFDDLVYTACTTFTDIRPIVFAYGVLASEMRVTAPRPKILKLHGDFLYSKLRNTGEETRAQDPNMARQVLQVLNEYGLIVIGYSGNDELVMKILDQMPEQNDLYWCVRRGDEPNARVKKLLEDKRGCLIEIDGFDAMMNEVRSAVRFDVATMLGAIIQRQDELIERLESFPAEDQWADILAEIATALEKQSEQQQTTARKHRALAHFAQGLKAHQAGNLSDAEAEYREAIRLDPNDAAAYHQLAHILAEDTERRSEAEGAFDKAASLESNRAEHFYCLGNLLARDPARTADAEAAFREAIRLAPNNAAAIANLAYLLRTQDRFDEAEPFYRRAIELEPDDPRCYFGLTMLLRQTGRPAEAIPLLEKMLQLDPQDADAPLALASVHKKLAFGRIRQVCSASTRAHQARGLVQSGVLGIGVRQHGHCP